MIKRVVLTEVRRGVAPLGAAAFVIIGTAMLFNETQEWAGRWSGLAGYLRVALIVLVPMALAAGAWQGGRERRRRIGELLASTPRPVWQQTVLRWSGVAVGVCGGFVAVWTICAVFVARVATYSGGGWYWQVLVGLVTLGAATAIGLGIGRALPWRVTAPIVGLAGYVGIGVLSYVEGDDGRGWLSPAVSNAFEGSYLPVSFLALQSIWFAALGATALVFVGARSRWVAVGPAAVAAAAGAIIAVGPGDDRWLDDAAALEPVCVDGTPDVCTTRENAFLLDDFAAVAGDVLGRWDGIDGVPARVQAAAYDHEWDVDKDVASVTLRPFTSWLGTLSRTGEYGASLESDLIVNFLPMVYECSSGDDGEVAMMLGDISQVALLWAGGDPNDSGTYIQAEGDEYAYRSGGEVTRSPVQNAYADRFASWSDSEQRSWIERYVAAADSCDVMTLDELLEDLS